MTQLTRRPPRTGPRPARRWWTLAVLCTSLVLITIDTTILNVAIPTLSAVARHVDGRAPVDRRRLHGGVRRAAAHLRRARATASGGAGSLALGLLVFGLGCAASALVDSATALIAMRAITGVGAALIFPATLSIITNVFTEPVERQRAIAIWAEHRGHRHRPRPAHRRRAARALLLGLDLPREHPGDRARARRHRARRSRVARPGAPSPRPRRRRCSRSSASARSCTA